MQEGLSLPQLRQAWSDLWGIEPHRWISQSMLERSIDFKRQEQDGFGLNAEQKRRLYKIITAYKRNPNHFEQGHTALKPGMRLIRNWKGKAHTVTVTTNGFMYHNKEYSSLSTIANDITGSRWNGWLFFGLKNKKDAA